MCYPGVGPMGVLNVKSRVRGGKRWAPSLDSPKGEASNLTFRVLWLNCHQFSGRFMEPSGWDMMEGGLGGGSSYFDLPRSLSFECGDA